jgi:non-ribosomal peptide synthetase-like protein
MCNSATIQNPPCALRGPRRPDLLRAECLAGILAATAQRRPQHPALIDGGRVVTYAALHAAGSTIGGALARRGAAAGRVVGLLLPRGADLLLAQAGITTSGAAWLPFDAGAPVERVRTCLVSAQAIGLVTSRERLPQFAGWSMPVWAVEDLLAEPATPVIGAAQPADPAYVIYTSGSTGQPKGIAVSHRSICHFLRSENEVLGVCERDIVYQGFSVAFDMSFEEIWISYLVGATLWIAPSDLVSDPERVVEAVTRHGITVMHAVPTLMGLIHHPLPTVRLLNLGGEACPDALVGRFAGPGRRIFNTYGPTEAAVSASIAALEPDKPVTIGLPLPNVGMLVLDERQQPLPVGSVGELCIFGPGLAIEYLGRPELTAERFITNPLADFAGEARLYRTGDLARIESAQGPVSCLGRVDDQVKIRGFRVELGEIEAALAAHPGVATPAVVLRPVAGIEQLVGFVIPRNGQVVESVALRRCLSERLPSYMVPSCFEIVSELPRLASGKVDRKALQNIPLRMNADADADGGGSGGPALPLHMDEAVLWEAVRKLFPGRALHCGDDFFDDLGGHSLLAARLASIIRADARYAALSVGDVYRARRLDAIASVMESLRVAHQAATATEAVPLLPRNLVPRRRRILCGFAQAAVTPLLVLLNISTWLAPFFVYHYFTGDEGDSMLLAALYSVGTFLLMEIASFGLAIAGKWLVAGQIKPGRYPLWGPTYFRWWLADRFCHLAPVGMLTGTPMLNWHLRALGARIGRDVLVDSISLGAPDLLTVGDGVSIGTAVHIENARVEDGLLVIGPVHLGRNAVVDSYAVLENDTTLGAGARLSGLSALAAGWRIPDGEMWEGSPARRVDVRCEPMPPRPQPGFVPRAIQVAFFAIASLAVAVLFFMPLFPSFMLIDWMDMHLWNLYENEARPLFTFTIFFLLAIPASALLVTMTILLASGLKRLLLPRQPVGMFSVYGATYCRTWLVARILDGSLGVLHGLYASVFAPTWLRLMGAQVGRGSEVSTATGIVPDLLHLGEHCFIADGVMLGDEEQRGGWKVLRQTNIGNRSFVGNGAYVADGAAIPDDVLIGVQTRTPENAVLRSGQTWLGSPPILLPARECIGGFDERLTLHPSKSRWLGRATVEGLRTVFPLAFAIAAGYLIVQMVMPLAGEEKWLKMVLGLALAGCLYGAASFLLVVALKWPLLGRYRPFAAPIWTPFVWLSEAVTNLYESLAVPNFLDFLCGTPMLPYALRLLGAHIGRDVYLNTTDITEFDCVRIGDAAELNAWCGPQTHLFEDRVMKIGVVDIGSRVSIGACSTILYDTHVGDGVRLGPLTLIAKGERLPANTRWEGAPAAPTAIQPQNIEY